MLHPNVEAELEDGGCDLFGGLAPVDAADVEAGCQGLVVGEDAFLEGIRLESLGVSPSHRPSSCADLKGHVKEHAEVRRPGESVDGDDPIEVTVQRLVGVGGQHVAIGDAHFPSGKRWRDLSLDVVQPVGCEEEGQALGVEV